MTGVDWPFRELLTPEQQRLLRSRVLEREFPSDALVLDEQTDGPGALLVTSGRLRLYMLGSEGHGVTLFYVEKGECLRRKLGIPSGTRAEVCYACHAEQNAILQAAKLGISIDGATLYCTHQPCSMCSKMIINAGIKRVIYEQGYPDAFSLEFFKETGVQLEKYDAEEAGEGKEEK